MSTTFKVLIKDLCSPHIENKKICNITNLCYCVNNSITLSRINLRGKGKGFSHSLIAVGAVGVRVPL